MYQKNHIVKCEHCGVYSELGNPQCDCWACESCNHLNGEEHDYCVECGAYRHCEYKMNDRAWELLKDEIGNHAVVYLITPIDFREYSVCYRMEDEFKLRVEKVNLNIDCKKAKILKGDEKAPLFFSEKGADIWEF